MCHGTPAVVWELPYKPTLHTVVLVGARKRNGRFYFLAQTFCYLMQFVEFSVEYLAQSSATVTFIKDTAPLDFIYPLNRSVKRFEGGQTSETALDLGRDSDDDEQEEDEFELD